VSCFEIEIHFLGGSRAKAVCRQRAILRSCVIDEGRPFEAVSVHGNCLAPRRFLGGRR
jgi:hypothetical protein